MKPEQNTQPAADSADKYITITVAEYICLLKAATLLEVIVNDNSYANHAMVAAVKATVQDMVSIAEAGAEE